MSYINQELLNNENQMKRAERVIWEITSALQMANRNRGLSSVISAYLLHKTSQFNYPFSVSYQDIMNGQLGIDKDILSVVGDCLCEEEWERLKPLMETYASEDFAVAAYSFNHASYDRISASEETPESVGALAQAILAIKAEDTVADLCCGMGSFMLSAKLKEPHADYCGYEIQAEKKVIASLRADLLGEGVAVCQTDVFTLLDDTPSKYDKIFSNYPFGMKLKVLGAGTKYLEQLGAKYPGVSKTTSSDWVFNALLCDLLKEDGKAVGIMTNGSTWNSIDIPMRKLFVEEGLVEAVISLPAKMFGFTNIPTSMIVLSRGNTAVRLIDATALCHQGRRYNEFDADDICKIIEALHTDSDYSKVVSADDLRANEYALSLSRYLESNIEFKNGVPFESVILSISRGAPITAKQLDEIASDNATNIQYLMLANIQNGIIDNKLPYLSEIDPKLERYCLKHNDLILSKNGYPYKVAVASVEDGQRILASGNLYIIQLDETKANPYYLKAFFESEQGIAVLKSITVGATIPNIGVDKLKKVSIPLPSLDEQKRIADKYQAAMEEIASLKLRLEKATSRLQHIFDEETN